MEQVYEENGLKEGGVNAAQKMGSGTGKSNVGRTGSSMGSMAMKIPSKQPQKTQTKQSKGNSKSSQNKNSTENAVSGNQVNHANGIQNPKQTKEGQRQTKDEKNSKRFNIPQSSKSKSGSRSNSVSPVNQTAENEEQRVKDEEFSGNDAEKTAQSLKQILSVGQPSRIVYSRIQLLNISGNTPSKHRPICLEKDFDTNGRWDPENWHRSFSTPLSASVTSEKVRKFSFSENRDRFQDDLPQGGIILGPQRRSFQDGCHVTSSTGSGSRLSKLHVGSPTESSGLNSRHGRPRLVMRQRSETTSDYEGPNPLNRERQIESASALRTEEFDWERDGRRSDTGRFRERNLSDLRSEPRGRGPRDLPRDLHELRSEYSRDHRENDYKDYRERKFSHNSSRDYGWYQGRQDRQDSRQNRYTNIEPEPEWYTAGPTSQFDTIELSGFEEASNDFSSWGGEIPMDDIKTKNKAKEEQATDDAFEDGELENSKESEGKESENVRTDAKEETVVQGNDDKANEKDESAILQNISEMDINDLLNIPGFTGVMEEIINEDSLGGKDDENQSRFSQWFGQKNQIENLKKESESRGSTPHEELENLAELAAERGLASPVDIESKQTKPQQHIPVTRNDLIHLLAQSKGGNVSPGGNATSLDQTELTKRMLLQQMKAGSVLSVSELEAKTGVRRSPQNYQEVDVQNTDAFNKLVASIRKKDEMKQRIIAQHQTAMKFADSSSGQFSMNMNSSPINRIPSPEELALHTQNIFQQALIKRQLEKQKDAYKEKIRLMEQQRREEQLREAIRSADAKMQESKQMNKRELQNMAFMPTSVIRKMHNSARDAKMMETADMYNIQQQQQMMQSGDGGTNSETLASATASFSAKLANSTKKAQNAMNPSQGGGNDLLSRIYQSATLTQQSGAKPTITRQDSNPGGLRRNASYPDVLMESKINRTSAFHQPASRHGGNEDPKSEAERLCNMLALQKGVQPPKPSSGLKQQQFGGGGLAADFFNNNLLKAEAQSQVLAGKFDQGRKPTAESMESDLKNQQEVVFLTQAVLYKCGISEEQLSRLTPQQQQAVVSIVRDQYYQLQAQKMLMEKKKTSGETLKAKQGELPPTNSTKNEIQNIMMGKNNFGVMKQGDDPGQKLSASTASGMKMNQPQLNTFHGGVPVSGIPGLLHNSAHHMSHHPLQLRPMVPPPMAQFIPPPMTRGPAMIPTTFLPPPGRMMGPPPPNVSLASPLSQPYQAAALMQMQIYQQQQQQRALLAAAAMQQQHQAIAAQQVMQAQAMAAARQHQSMKDNPRAGGNASEFHNPLERWFSRDVLSQSQMPAIHHGKHTLTASDIERMNVTNQKQE